MKVSKNDIIDYIADNLIFASHGNGDAKTLKIYVNILEESIFYETCDHRDCVYRGDSLDDAILAYNQL